MKGRKERLFQSTVRRGKGGKHESGINRLASRRMNRSIASIGNFPGKRQVKWLMMYDKMILIACHCSFSCNLSESDID